MTNIRRMLEAAAGNSGDKVYVEDVFSTDVWTGDGSSALTVNNGIDLDGEGGMVWVKGRSTATTNCLVDTERLVSASNTAMLHSDTSAAQATAANEFGAFTSTGYTIPYNTTAGWTNFGTRTNVGWSFRKAPGFFDIQTWSGNQVSGRQIAHNLESIPGCIIIKCSSGASSEPWYIYHRATTASDPEDYYLNFGTYGASNSDEMMNDTAPTAEHFTIGQYNSVNGNGNTYVAYLFAHDVQTFGAGGDQSIIKCASFTPSGGNASIDVGFQPQWVLIKKTVGSGGNWYLQDTMRGLPAMGGNNGRFLRANGDNAEDDSGQYKLTTTGFTASGQADVNYIFIAIRMPMKVPTAATEVFKPAQGAGTGVRPNFNSGFVTDASIRFHLPGTATLPRMQSRITGNGYIVTHTASTEVADTSNAWDFMDGWFANDVTPADSLAVMFKRAPGFFDVVAYTGDGASDRAVPHNLTVAPEFYVVKGRDASYDWQTYSATMGNNYSLRFNQANGIDVLGTFPYWADTSPTATAFYVDNTGNPAVVNGNGKTFVAYLFATLAGVSKVGGYTGTAADLNVPCGFSAGARFVLIKRYDTTGDWYVFNSESGIVAGNSPYVLLNSAAAEVTNTDYIDPLASGFTITSSAPAGLNANGGSYIFLAIA